MLSQDLRWDSAIDRLSAKYGLHLDDWKRIGPNQMGQKCGRGWVGLRGACKRGKKGDKAAIKESKQALAAKIRKKKGMSEIKDRDGKRNPIAYAFVPGNQKSSTMTARRTGPKSGVSGGGRLANIQRTEEKRQQIASGVFPGKTITERFEEADRIREKYGSGGGTITSSKPKSTKGAEYLADPRTTRALKNHEGMKKLANALDFNGGIIDLGDGSLPDVQLPGGLGIVRVVKLHPKSKKNTHGSATIETDRGEGVERINMPLDTIVGRVKRVSQESASEENFKRQNATIQKNMTSNLGKITPIASAKPLKDLFAEGDRIGAKYEGPTSLTDRRIAKQQADRIMEESGTREAVDRAMGVRPIGSRRLASRAEIDNAPVRLSNERSSKQPRRRGRSVD